MPNPQDEFSPSLAAKAKEEAAGEQGSDDSSTEDDLSYRWTDEGTVRPDGRVEHQSLEVVVNGSKSIVKVGDSIFLKSDEEDSKDRKFYGDDKEGYYGTAKKESEPIDAFVARVEEMWEDPLGGRKRSKELRMKIRARWFFKKHDLESLHGNFAGPISRQQVLSTMTNRDLILGDQADDNDVLTILGKCTVLQRRPTDDPVPVLPLPNGTFICRYGIEIGTVAPGTLLITSYDGENDDWPVVQVPNSMGIKRSAEQQDLPPKRARKQYDLKDAAVVECDSPPAGTDQPSSVGPSFYLEKSSSTNESDTSMNRAYSPNSGSESNEIVPLIKDPDADAMSSDDEMSDDMSSSSFRSEDDERPQETEGSTTVGRIHVGQEYQAVVPPFDSQKPFPRTSRNPTLLWKGNSVSDDILDDYLSKAADILNDFLEENEFLTEDPYTPLPTEKSEAKDLAEAHGRPLTMSHVSTASSVSAARNKLTRECKVDALMSVLLRHNHDTKVALEEVAASPQDVLTVWTPSEKELFNSGFRRYSGSLRMISKQGLAASKNFKDVIDYHYRFKIPDQFRRYQEKKTELAVRMMECIESRKYYESLIPRRSENLSVKSGGNSSSDIVPIVEEKKQARDWAKTSGTELLGAAEDRRIGAKELLCEVKNEMGKDKMVQVASVVKSYQNRSSIPELKESLVELLQERPDLLERFMDFFPLRFR